MVISAIPGAGARVVAVAVAGRVGETVGSGAFLSVGGATVDCVEEAALAAPDESTGRLGAAGLAGGNSSCETAIAMSDKNRARKKRLSIQGTGS
jgi:hypothetical protein